MPSGPKARSPQKPPSPWNRNCPGSVPVSGYGPFPGYGSPYPSADLPWPHGDRRPGIATAAAVLGFVTAGSTTLGCLSVLVGMLSGGGDPVGSLLLLGLPCAAVEIIGGVRLLAGHSPGLLFGACLAAVGVLLLAWAVGFGIWQNSDTRGGLSFFFLFALVLPVLTAVFAWLPPVRAWADGEPA